MDRPYDFDQTVDIATQVNVAYLNLNERRIAFRTSRKIGAMEQEIVSRRLVRYFGRDR